MKVGIFQLYDPNGKLLSSLDIYKKILSHNGIYSIQLNAEQLNFWNNISHLSLFIMNFLQYSNHMQQARDILPIIEHEYGIPCFPNQSTAWHYDDKIKQYYLLKSHGFPITKSWIFYDKNTALEWTYKTKYPIVFKLRGGAGSMNVILVKNQPQAKSLIKHMFGRGVLPEKFFSTNTVRFKHFSIYRELHHILGNIYRSLKGLDASPYWELHKNYILFQKFLPNNNFDTRITIIGDRAFGFRRLVRTNDFRASGSGKIDYDMKKIDHRCVRIAFDVSKKMKFQSMAYDFLFNENNEPEFCEISYTYISRAIYSCPGFWDYDLNWHEGHFIPEYLHLVDSLNITKLKQPDINSY